MKFKTNLLLVCFLFLSCSIFGQLSQDTRAKLPTAAEFKKMTKYRTILNLRNKTNVSGLLFKVTDEQVILIPNNEKIKDYSRFISLVRKEQIAINIPFIQRIGIRKKGKVEKILMIGVGIGVAVSFWGYLNVKDGDSLASGGVFTIPVLIGGILGLLTGSSSKSYNLNNKSELEKLKDMGIITGF